MYAVFQVVWCDKDPYEKVRRRRMTPRMTNVEEARRIRDELNSSVFDEMYAVYVESGALWLEVA